MFRTLIRFFLLWDRKMIGIAVGLECHCISWMHEVVPSVVAMAVRMVIMVCRIFCQSSFLFIVFLSYEL